MAARKQTPQQQRATLKRMATNAQEYLSKLDPGLTVSRATQDTINKAITGKLDRRSYAKAFRTLKISNIRSKVGVYDPFTGRKVFRTPYNPKTGRNEIDVEKLAAKLFGRARYGLTHNSDSAFRMAAMGLLRFGNPNVFKAPIASIFTGKQVAEYLAGHTFTEMVGVGLKKFVEGYSKNILANIAAGITAPILSASEMILLTSQFGSESQWRAHQGERRQKLQESLANIIDTSALSEDETNDIYATLQELFESVEWAKYTRNRDKSGSMVLIDEITQAISYGATAKDLRDKVDAYIKQSGTGTKLAPTKDRDSVKYIEDLVNAIKTRASKGYTMDDQD